MGDLSGASSSWSPDRASFRGQYSRYKRKEKKKEKIREKKREEQKRARSSWSDEAMRARNLRGDGVVSTSSGRRRRQCLSCH
jgi:hypothetical protein